MNADVAVLIPAAGLGRRLGGARKQFRMLGDRMLLLQTLLRFERHSEVDHIVVAVNGGQDVETAIRVGGVSKLAAIVEGGSTRQESVRIALSMVPGGVGVVLVHDAVRPFVLDEEISRVIELARKEGAASMGVPVADTLRKGERGCFGETVPRDGLYRMQTPQGFRRDWIEAAHEMARTRGFVATDDVELVQRCGYRVRLVEGGDHNLKITTPADLAWAQRFWPFWKDMLEQPD